MLFYFVMVGSQIKDDINSARYGEGSRASLTVIFFPEVRNRKETERGVVVIGQAMACQRLTCRYF